MCKNLTHFISALLFRLFCILIGNSKTVFLSDELQYLKFLFFFFFREIYIYIFNTRFVIAVPIFIVSYRSAL